MAATNSYNERKLLGKSLFFITAHPDDETFTAAGTIYKNHQAGGGTTVVCATLGEKGSSHLPQAVSPEELKSIRKHEFEEVSRMLHIDRLHLLDLPDTQVREHVKTFFDHALRLTQASQPDIIIGFDETGISGHSDHITAGEVARQVAEILRLPLATFTVSDKYRQEWRETLQSRRKKGRYQTIPDHCQPNITVNIDPTIKRQALQCHRSQFSPPGPLAKFPETIAQDMLVHEYFLYSDEWTK